MRPGSNFFTMASARRASLALFWLHESRARIVEAVDLVGVHVLVVAGRVVAHGVGHDRRMVLGRADVELGMPGVAVGPIGVGGLPVVMGEVRLRERHEHPHVVRRPQDLREAHVGTRLAAIVVRVDEVDAEALEALHGLPRPA